MFDHSLHKFDTYLWSEHTVEKNDYRNQYKKPFKLISKDFPVIFVHQEDDNLPLSMPVYQGCSIFKEVWPQMGLYCYLGIQNGQLDEIRPIGYQSVTHYASLLHEFWLDSENVFHVDFEKNYLHIYCKEDGRFLFYNKLYFYNEVDVHYNLALVVNKVWNNKIAPNIIFSGEVARDSKIIKTLSSYFADFRFINDKTKDLVINDELVDPTHFDMYLISACV